MRRTLLLPALTLLLLAAAPAAHARVMVVATGNAFATLLDVQSGALVARVPVAGGTRAVAVAPDGSRGYVAAGAGVAAIDLNARTRVGDVQLTRDADRRSRSAPAAIGWSPSARARWTPSTRSR